MSLSQDPRHQLSMRYDDILIDSRNSPYTVVTNCWALGHIVNHPPKPTVLLQKPQQQEFDLESSSSKESDNSSNSADSTENNNDESNDTNASTYQEGPNCILVLLNYTDKMISNDNDKQQQRTNLKEYIPNEYEIPPKPLLFTNNNDVDDDGIIMHGMGLISIRDVKDEELFYDYRLSPDNGNDDKKYPSWYHVWDEESINNRWDDE